MAMADALGPARARIRLADRILRAVRDSGLLDELEDKPRRRRARRTRVEDGPAEEDSTPTDNTSL